MSDTSKVTPWKAHSPWTQDDPRWTVSQKDGMGFTTLGGKDEEHAKLAEKALNSYNPERDRLARELAEMIEVAQEFRERMQSIPADWGAIEGKARQLLKLYEEVAPSS